MSRLIDADELKRQALFGITNDGIGMHVVTIEQIDEQPTIEAEPVRHGHWNGWTAMHWTRKCDDYGDPIYAEHTYYACSGCRRRTIIKSAYCPACGRKMDEVSE